MLESRLRGRKPARRGILFKWQPIRPGMILDYEFRSVEIMYPKSAEKSFVSNSPDEFRSVRQILEDQHLLTFLALSIN